MKLLATMLVLGSLLNATLVRGQSGCEITVSSSIEVDHADLSVADVLAPGNCPAIRTSAAEVNLGKVPLPGSVRVIEGNQVRALLHGRLGNLKNNLAVSIPERVTIRRNARLTCAEIANRIFPGVPDIDCTAADRIPREAQFEVARRVWNSSTKTRDFVIRCTRPGDCVPFLVRVPEANAVADPPGLHPSPRPDAQAKDAHSPVSPRQQTLVYRGQSASVVWDQDGIRAEVSVVCLDQGRQGDLVRARVVHTGRILRAVVVGPGRLRVHS
jgi:hypothetical protein